MFEFLGNLVSATVKIAVTPITVLSDVVNGEPFEKTGDLLNSAIEDIEEIFDDED